MKSSDFQWDQWKIRTEKKHKKSQHILYPEWNWKSKSFTTLSRKQSAISARTKIILKSFIITVRPSSLIFLRIFMPFMATLVFAKTSLGTRPALLNPIKSERRAIQTIPYRISQSKLVTSVFFFQFFASPINFDQTKNMSASAKELNRIEK